MSIEFDKLLTIQLSVNAVRMIQIDSLWVSEKGMWTRCHDIQISMTAEGSCPHFSFPFWPLSAPCMPRIDILLKRRIWWWYDFCSGAPNWLWHAL